MSEKTIRVSDETWRWLKDKKREGESFEEVLARLRTQDKWSGFGALADTGIADGVGRAREQLKDEFETRVGEGN